MELLVEGYVWGRNDNSAGERVELSQAPALPPAELQSCTQRGSLSKKGKGSSVLRYDVFCKCAGVCKG